MWKFEDFCYSSSITVAAEARSAPKNRFFRQICMIMHILPTPVFNRPAAATGGFFPA